MMTGEGMAGNRGDRRQGISVYDTWAQTWGS